MERIVVTGMGAICALGATIDQIHTSLVSCQSGIDTIQHLDTIHSYLPAGEIPYSDTLLADMAGVSHLQGITRTGLISLIAAQQAVAHAGLPATPDVRTGFISATTVGGMREFERYYIPLQDLSLEGEFTQYAATLDSAVHTEMVARQIGVTEYVTTVSTACSSSSNALILGAEMIRHGLLDRVICGGADAFCKFTINGFNSLMILDKQPCRPFDKTRSGLNLGEGAAYLVIESEAIARQRNAKVHAVLAGYSNSNDAFHQTASSPDGRGAMLSMQRACDMAGVPLSAIDYINAHGTATENNDLSECLAIQQLFEGHSPYFSSTKAYTGHTLAAAGSLEAVFSILGMTHGQVYPNLRFTQRMDEVAISPVSSLLTGQDIRHCLSNSFGFGGSNTSLLLSRPTP
jgi:3-oxoacyl-(acyl-carrier-protein) synthase